MNKIKSTNLSARSKKTTNNERSASYTLPAKERLVTGVLTCFFKEPKSYGDTSDDLIQAARELIKEEPEFVAKLAAYARKEFHMRTISQVLAAEVAKGAKGNRIVRKMIRKVIERPDDITNILTYWFDTFGTRKNPKGEQNNPVTRSLRRGIADVFPRFDEYQLAKYRGEKNLVKLRDALLIARPKPISDEQGALWKRLIEGKLKTPETRETVLSKKGQSKEVWEDLIDSGKLGFMAMLRNISNFLKNDVSDAHIAKVTKRLMNENAVNKSKQLPFRFFTAYKMLNREHCGQPATIEKLKDALSEALSLSVKNMPTLEGTTYMTADESGSMTTPVSMKSIVTMMEIGNLLMATADSFCEKSVISVFGDTTEEVNVTKDMSILDKMDEIKYVGRSVGMSTKLVTAIDYITDKKIKVDRIIVFSDMQAYDKSLGYGWYGNTNKQTTETEVENALSKYRAEVNPDVWVHSIDLSGFGTVKTKGPKVNLIAGWSEKIFNFIKLAENSSGSLVEEINNYDL